MALLSAGGCTATIAKEAIPAFRHGVLTAQQQTASTLADVNVFLREQQVERAIGQPALSEELFLDALDSADLAKWDRAFALIDSYAEKLERLLDPDRRAGVETELAALGEKLGTLREDEIPLEVSAAFTKLGGLLVDARAQRNAVKIVREVDPAIQQVFSTMMEAIGENREAGIRLTVWTSRTQVMSRIAVREFLRASGDSPKRAAVHRYLEAMEEREAHDSLLASLRLSIGALAKAHNELARGRPASADVLIRIIQHEYQAYRAQLEAGRTGAADGSGNGGTT